MTVELSGARECFSVEFPGLVKNEATAYSMLGGAKLLNCGFSKENIPELQWRKNDDFSKPILGEKLYSRPKLILKVIKRKSGKIDLKLEGIVKFEVKFPFLSPCQYLPVSKDVDSTQYVSIQNSLVPLDIKNYSYISAPNTPLFIVPPLFLRSNRQPDTFFRCKTMTEMLSIDCDEQDKFEDVRGNRAVNWFTVKYGDLTPTEDMHRQAISNGPSEEFPHIVNFLKDLFSERPIWSTTAVRWRFTSKFKGVINSSRMLTFLGQVAYYIENGPWQRLWCKIGYNPMDHPKESKIYQVVDFRLSRSILKAQAFSENAQIRQKGAHCFSDISSVEGIPNPPHIFKPGILPVLACTYFQVCDIEIEEVQNLIHSNDNQEPKTCHRVDGFLITNYGNIFRRHMITSLLPADKVQSFLSREMVSYKKKKRKRNYKKSSKLEGNNDTVQQYITSVEAALLVGANEETSSNSEDSLEEETEARLVDDGSGESTESSQFEDDEDEDIDNFMHVGFQDRPEILEQVHLRSLSVSVAAASDERASSSNTDPPSHVDLRRLWQETSNAGSGDGDSTTLEFPQL